MAGYSWLSNVGSGISGWGQIVSGFYGAQQADDEKAVAKYNAALMFARAKAIRMKTKFDQERQAEEGTRTQGDLRASIGGSGIVATQGAPLQALALQKTESALENYLIGYQGRVEANEAESQGQIYLAQAKAAGKRSKQSLVSGFASGIGTMLS